ncbi:MAG: DUF3325 domain-containing protein [Pseudomonadota bacterium]
MLSTGFGLACLGIVLLSLSLKRHYLQVWPQNENFRRWRLAYRIVGYLCVGLALMPCVLADDLWIGLVMWSSMLAAAAFLQTIFLTYWPRHSPWFAVVAVALISVELLY